MLSRTWRWLAGLAVVVGAGPCVGLAQSAGTVVMVKAELLKPLDAGRLKVGDTFYLKTKDNWQRPDCTVHSQSRVAAQVTRLERPAGGKGTELAVRFQAMPCAESERLLMTPLLVALGSKPDQAPLGLQRLMAAGAEGAALQALFVPKQTAGVKVPVSTDLNKFETAPLYSFSNKGLEDGFRTGDVKGIRGVKMHLPEGTSETTLSASKSLYLEAGTVFVLTMVAAVPGGLQAETRQVLRAEAVEKARPGQVAVAAVKPVEAAEVCAANGCVEAVAGGAAGQAMWSRPVDGLGFMPRLKRVVLGMGQGLDDDAAVAFLGEDEVLLAFNTHKLMARTAAEAAEGRKPRLVRAMVFSRTDGRLIKAEDWAVESEVGPFLWSLGGGRVLAHVGEELVELSAGLEVKERTRLHGPLLFLSTATGDGPMLAATIKERHQPGEHARMAGFLRQGEVINEDYELTAIDGNLRTIGSKTVPVVPLRPALLADAMVSARADKGGLRYSVEEQLWTGDHKLLATVGSGCDVQVNTLAAKVLYVSGCDTANRLHGWYRLMTPAGATLMKGSSGSTDLLQQALSDQAGKRFVTVSTNFSADTFASLNIAEGDFKQLTVSLFDTKTGKEMFHAVPAGGSAMRQAVALSGAGEWLAVLSGTTLQVYGVQPERAP